MASKNNPFMPGDDKALDTLPAINSPLPGGNAAADSFEVDLSETTDNYKVDDGAYRLKCVEIEQSISQSGNPMFIWSFVIVDGKFSGREFKMWTAITPAAMWKVAEAVQALGVGQTGQVVKFNRSDVVNKECGGLIEVQEYNGNERSTLTKLISLKELSEIK